MGKNIKKKAPKEAKNAGYREQYGVIIICQGEPEQKRIYERLYKEGFKCRVVVT